MSTSWEFLTLDRAHIFLRRELYIFRNSLGVDWCKFWFLAATFQEENNLGCVGINYSKFAVLRLLLLLHADNNYLKQIHSSENCKLPPVLHTSVSPILLERDTVYTDRQAHSTMQWPQGTYGSIGFSNKFFEENPLEMYFPGGSVAALGSLFSDRFPMCSSSIVFSVRVIVCLFSLLFCWPTQRDLTRAATWPFPGGWGVLKKISGTAKFSI